MTRAATTARAVFMAPACFNLHALPMTWRSALCSLFLTSYLGASGLQDAFAQSPATLSDAYDAYFQGRLLDAQEIVDRLPIDADDPLERAFELSRILELCGYLKYQSCLNANGFKLGEVLQKSGGQFPMTSQEFLRGRFLYAILLERTLVKDKNSIRKFFPDVTLRAAIRPFADPILYAQAQILGAELYQDDHLYPEARDAAARALAGLTVLKAKDRFLVARTLAHLIRLNVLNEDIERALAWLIVSGRFIAENLPPNSIEAAEFAATASMIWARTRSRDALVTSLETTQRLVAALQIEPSDKRHRLATITAHLAAVYALQGDFAAARSALALSPAASQRNDIIDRGRLADWPEFVFATGEVFVSSASGEPPDVRWLPAFQSPIEWARSTEAREEAEGYRLFALGLLLVNQDRAEARRNLTLATKSVLSRGMDRFNESWDSFPLISDVDELMLTTGLVSLVQNLGSAPEDAGDVLQAIEILNRQSQSIDGDYLTLVASQPTEEGRRLAHSAAWMHRQQWLLEIKLIQYLIDKLRSERDLDHESSEPTDKKQYRLQRAVSKSLDLQNAVKNALSARGLGSRFERIPTLERLQNSLRPGEAYLTTAFTVLGVTSLCVRKHQVWTSWNGTFSGAELANDVRLLSLALSASHAPSSILDTQYPVDSAIRVRKVLLGGIEDCLPDGTAVFYAPPGPLASLPLGVLLTSAPPSRGSGWDLSKADWLALKYRFSIVTSASHFIAARQRSLVAGAGNTFVGIGDPRLSQSIAERPAGELLASRSSPTVGGELSELPELPETRAELIRIAGLLGSGNSTLLLGTDATENSFRHLLSSEANVLHFATHGLVGEDLLGVSEASLVLTPESPSDRLNDGLLTAGELGTLVLNARLIVLSACNSANFDLRLIGSKLQGLTTAVALSGVPTVIASLWPVESTTGQLLMESFYQRLSETPHRTIGEAFQTAIHEHVRNPRSIEYAHPRFWAPFTAIGDGEARISLRTELSQSATAFRLQELGNRGTLLKLLMPSRRTKAVISSSLSELVSLSNPKGSKSPFENGFNE